MLSPFSKNKTMINLKIDKIQEVDYLSTTSGKNSVKVYVPLIVVNGLIYNLFVKYFEKQKEARRIPTTNNINVTVEYKDTDDKKYSKIYELEIGIRSFVQSTKEIDYYMRINN